MLKCGGTIFPVALVTVSKQFPSTGGASELKWVPENPVIPLEVMKKVNQQFHLLPFS